MRFSAAMVGVLWASACAHAPDVPRLENVGPAVIAIDAAHNNYHTADGRYAPFATVLREAGFEVVSNKELFSDASLAKADVLVVSNALGKETVWPWRLPARPAFTTTEAAAVRRWVETGGSLFLIVDHMPFPGDMAPLSDAFGVKFDNGFALWDETPSNPEVFTGASGTIKPHEVTRGITQVRSFGGSSFKLPAGAVPLLRLDKRWTIKLPVEAMQFPPDTPTRPASTDDFRGAAIKIGKGRVVVFSEAGMFTSQGPVDQAEGFTSPGAEQNKQLLLNIARWLAPAR
jgi:hypothetical protein